VARASVLAAILGLAAPAAAQMEPVTFQTPDGSRFVLIADATIPQVHWAVASPADPAEDPPGYEGLAWTTAQVSLHGTWRTGSRDATREREALAQLDNAWQSLLAGGTTAADLERLDEQARALADLATFPRVLASAPTWRPEVVARGPVAVLVLTTLPGALDEVARLLVERREEQALRELPRAWVQTFSERSRAFLADRRRPVRAEALALAMPDHPANRAIEPPAPTTLTRERAFAAWHRTQRPERTVHVLLGDFDPAAARAVLQARFASTALPATPPSPAPAARPLAGMRRSAVQGVPIPSVTIAWQLPPGADRFVLATALRWLADGIDSELGRALVQKGRTATTRAEAPWPATLDGRGLVLVEASDRGGIDGLADLLLAACRDAAARPPDAQRLQAVTAALQRDWRQAHADPRQATIDVAAAMLAWPQQAATLVWPDAVAAEAVRELLARTFGAPPVIVEGRP
jgi:hypothetical protein